MTSFEKNKIERVRRLRLMGCILLAIAAAFTAGVYALPFSQGSLSPFYALSYHQKEPFYMMSAVLAAMGICCLGFAWQKKK